MIHHSFDTAQTYTIDIAGLCSTRVPNMGLLCISPNPDSVLPVIGGESKSVESNEKLRCQRAPCATGDMQVCPRRGLETKPNKGARVAHACRM